MILKLSCSAKLVGCRHVDLVNQLAFPPFCFTPLGSEQTSPTTMTLTTLLTPLRRPLLLRLTRHQSTYTLISPSTPRPRVALIELNRPKALNALSSPLMAELNAHLKSLDQNTEVGAIVLTGGEKVFAGSSHLSNKANVSWCRYQRVCTYSDKC